MRKQNIVSWSALMAGLFYTGLAFQVCGLFKNIVLEENLCPNEYALAAVITSCLGNLKRATISWVSFEVNSSFGR
ncbi:hypothetical protein LguiB_012623 [Lonicera macranthoides]